MSIIAAEMSFSGGTIEKYDEVIGKMGFEPRGQGAPGLLFHWAAKTEDGIKVTDVWESAEQFQQFADEQIGPLTQEAGLNPPEVTTYPVHNYLSESDA